MTSDPGEAAKRLTVICDACVLYSIALADLLTSLGEAGLFRPRWTHEIHDEWIRNVIAQRGESGAVTRAKLEARRDAMISAIEDSLVEDYKELIPSITLPDPNDRHVLAAAIKAEADLILTFNLKDFPEAVLAPFGITAKHPDDFATERLRTNLETVVIALREMRRRRKRPPINAEDFLVQLERQGLKDFVAALRTISAEI